MTLTTEDRADVAFALLVWRYVDHFRGRQTVTPESVARQNRALALAKKIGIKDDYLRTVFDRPVLAVTVRDLDAPRSGTTRKGSRAHRRAKYAR